MRPSRTEVQAVDAFLAAAKRWLAANSSLARPAVARQDLLPHQGLEPYREKA